MNSIQSSSIEPDYFSIPFEDENNNTLSPLSSPKSKSWNAQLVDQIEQWEESFDEYIPSFAFQEKIDEMMRAIKERCAPLKEFNDWINSNGEGSRWVSELAVSLAKLPLRACRNILSMIFRIIETIFSFALHPYHSLMDLAKMIVNLINELTKPEVWSKIGAGMIGACLGQGLISGNPLSIIGLGIGAALLISGISFGALKVAINSERNSRASLLANYLGDQILKLPEAFLTGFFMGILIGAIQRYIEYRQMQSFRIQDPIEAKKFAEAFIKEHNLPPYTRIELDFATGKVSLSWSGKELYQLRQIHPDFLKHVNPDGLNEIANNFKITLGKESAQYELGLHVFDKGRGPGYGYVHNAPLETLGFKGNLYPLPPKDNAIFNSLGPANGMLGMGKNGESE